MVRRSQDSLSVPILSSLGHGSDEASRHQRSWRTPLAVSALIAVESGGLSVCLFNRQLLDGPAWCSLLTSFIRAGSMFFKPLDLTTALRPSLLSDETLLFVQDAVGLYEG